MDLFEPSSPSLAWLKGILLPLSNEIAVVHLARLPSKRMRNLPAAIATASNVCQSDLPLWHKECTSTAMAVPPSDAPAIKLAAFVKSNLERPPQPLVRRASEIYTRQTMALIAVSACTVVRDEVPTFFLCYRWQKRTCLMLPPIGYVHIVV